MTGKERYEKAKPSARQFIDARVGGESVIAAYRLAGYEGEDGAAWKLASDYRDAIDYRRDQLSAGSAEARAQSIARLTRIAEGNIADLFPDGLVISDSQWAELPRSTRALVSEVHRSEAKDGTVTVRIKLEARLAAEKQLASLEGWEAPKQVNLHQIEADLQAKGQAMAEALRDDHPEAAAIVAEMLGGEV